MKTKHYKTTLITVFITFFTLTPVYAEDFQKCLEKFVGTYTSEKVLLHIGKMKGCKKCYQVKAIVKGDGPHNGKCFKELHGKTLERHVGGKAVDTKDKTFTCKKDTLGFVAKFKFKEPIQSLPGEIDKGQGLVKQITEESVYVLKGDELVSDHYEKRTYASKKGEKTKPGVRQFHTTQAETYKKVDSSEKDFSKSVLEAFASKNCPDRKKEYFQQWSEEDLKNQWVQ